jgi:4-methyl-5(b-hydroxyethyl)-thiazole monophosphate biosynthesis
MSKKAIIFLADGFEEVEAVTPIDYLRRSGAEVTIAAVRSERTVKSSRGLAVLADTTVAELSSGAGKWSAASWDAVIVPGGMPGASNIAASAACSTLLKAFATSGKLIAAICAAPAVVLSPLGILSGRRFTCFPGMEKEVSGGRWSDDRVVTDGNLITSRSAGTAGEWARAVVAKLCGEEAAEKLTVAVLLK